MASMIETFNSTISKAINKYGPMYVVLFGEIDFTSTVPTLDSEDVNCGALCNELEFARLQTTEATESLTIDGAETDLLDILVETFVRLPRRGTFETDEEYRQRFKCLVKEQTNYRRHTRWAIIDALREFGIAADAIQLIEPFSSTSNYFELRLTSTEAPTDYTLFLDNDVTNGYMDQYYVGGVGVGYIETFLTEMLNRIKAAGVDYDVRMVQRGSIDATADAEVA